jgi:hypothetical protein
MEYSASASRKPVNATLRIAMLNGFSMSLQRDWEQSRTAAVVRTLPRVALHGLGIVNEILFLRTRIRRRRAGCLTEMQTEMQHACQRGNACIQAGAAKERRFFDRLLRAAFFPSPSLPSGQYPRRIL